MGSKKMKIIQSFWGGKNKDIQNSYGWVDHKLHWLAWMLSCHQLLKYYDEVELYTDEFGYDVLIRKLQLPYTKVHVVLDELNQLPDGLWAMAKIKTYSFQDEPFLHVDGDVFIFDSFPIKLLKADLIAQNQEITTNYYREMWNIIHPNLMYLPHEMEDFHQCKSNFAYNMGIFGGNDIEFIKGYCERSLNFVNQNAEIWDKINLCNFNVFFEQVFFNECVKEDSKSVEVLIKEDIGDNMYQGFGDFDAVPHLKTYLHLLGVFKQDVFTCSKMFQYCWYNFPHFIKRILTEITPELNQKLEFQFTKDENRELIEWYKEHLFEDVITPKRLLARDLYTYEQVIMIDEFEKSNIDYKIVILSEIILQETEDGVYNLFTKEIGSDIFIRKLDQMDEIILYELSTPKRKSELYEAIITHFEVEPTEDEKERFRTTLYKLIKHYIGLKIMTVVAL